jgi:deoxyribodipyrimidine photo-lyase
MAAFLQPDDTIFWFRRDLRLQDNAGLYHALKENSNVVPIFIFDIQILNELEDKHDRRVDFIFQSLIQLKKTLEEKGSTLLIFLGDPAQLFRSFSIKAVYANHDFEPYAIARDAHVKSILQRRGIPFATFKDHVIFEKDKIVKDNGEPYTVFTPYSKRWKAKLDQFYLRSYATARYFHRLKQVKSAPAPDLRDLGFEKSNAVFPKRIISQAIIRNYHDTRDYPAIQGTTRLSVHLRFGTVSIRKLVQLAVKENDTWLNELIWRDFYAMILFHFPTVVTNSFKPAYDRIEWRNDEEEFERWCKGTTGYPIVDAGMRELSETGFMHNRVRMITASFLTKHLLIDWRWGEAYFAKKLLDYDLASNNGGWQWAAGSGCDAAPYFRVFNPELQAKKFDPDYQYIRQWIPEWGTSAYPPPIVAHTFARERVLKTYKKALRQ